jgi:hypothetical protein
MKRRRQTNDWDDDGDIVKDGEGVRVRMEMCDSVQRQVRDQRTINDALSRHQALAAHRPGFCKDILRWSAYDAALEHGLRDAIEARDAAYEERTRRGDEAWKHLGDAAPDQPDQQMPPGILNGNGDDNDDDEDDDDDDDSELAKAQRARDQAYQQMRIRGDNAWRDMGGTSYGALPARPLDPSAPDRVQAQGMAWRHGR